MGEKNVHVYSKILEENIVKLMKYGNSISGVINHI